MKSYASASKEKAPVPQESHRQQRIIQCKGYEARTGYPLPPVQRKANQTGLPDNLKQGVENLSGYSMDDVKVHYNSSKPAQLHALAYAQGTDIHIGPGQEQHLPHEAWHVVQQKQGRVRATMQMKEGMNVNDDEGLEGEADRMGMSAETSDSANFAALNSAPMIAHPSHSIQFTKPKLGNLFSWLKRKKSPVLTSRDEVSSEDRIAGGNVNSVDLVTYNKPIAGNTPRGYFKENIDAEPSDSARSIGIPAHEPNWAARALATSRVADLLTDESGNGPGNTIARTVDAVHRGVKGTVSVDALYTEDPADENAQKYQVKKLGDMVITDKEGHDYIASHEGNYINNYGSTHRKGDPAKGEQAFLYYKLKDIDVFARTDYRNPAIQKNLSNLQLMDALTGQVDRHGENVFLNRNGEVTGIDHDISFGERSVGNIDELKRIGGSHSKGLPPLVDIESANMIRNLTEEEYEMALTGLSENEKQAALERLRLVKTYIDDLESDRKLVGQEDGDYPAWNEDTYNTQIFHGKTNSYLADFAKKYEESAQIQDSLAEGTERIIREILLEELTSADTKDLISELAPNRYKVGHRFMIIKRNDEDTNLDLGKARKTKVNIKLSNKI